MVTDVEVELQKVNLGDRRLRKRAAAIGAALQEHPDHGFPSVLDAKGLEGLYRLTNNRAVEPHLLLTPHMLAAWERPSESEYRLVLHDTTELSFSGESRREGLTFTGTRSVLQMHLSLLVDLVPAPVVHGVVGVRNYVVGGELWGEVVPGGELAALACGSDRWRDAASAVHAEAPPGRPLVHVMDREADDYSLWTHIVGLGDQFVIRSAQDRRTAKAPNGAQSSVNVHLGGEAFLFTREVQLSPRTRQRPPADVKRHPTRDARAAVLSVRGGPVRIRKPRNVWKRPDLPKFLDLNLVEVLELEPPEGCTPINWRIVTTLPTSTAAEVARVVDIYRKRWLVEEYFKALKSGCIAEERQAESRWALLNTMAFLLPIAVRLLQVRALGRHAPDDVATDLLDDVEICVLRELTGPHMVPARPTNRAIMLALGRLGGHLKSNGDPGWMVLARGHAKLLSAAAGWRAAARLLGKIAQDKPRPSDM